MIIILLLFWFILSSELSAFFIVAACLCAFSVTFIDKKLFTKLPFKPSLKHLFGFLSLLKDMLISGFYVAKIIFFNKKIISSSEWINIPKMSEFAKVAKANAITLTPGTMSMDIKNDQILVHSIKENS